MKIAGLDIGTTGCKCTVFDEQGRYLNKAYKDYPVRRSVSGHEVDVSTIMDGVYAVVAEMAKEYPDIAGIGVTSFGETFVMTDENGKPLHTAMLYTDPRGEEECKALTEKFGARELAGITGLRAHQMYSIPKMMWIKKNRPEIYDAAAYIFLMEDYVVYHLTGKRQIDYSLATRTMAFDIKKLDWSKEIFEVAGIDVNKMSKTVPTGTDAGAITAEAAEKTGLAPSTHIVSISHDQVSAAIGAGVDVTKPFGNLVVDIGAGTSDVAVISLAGVVVSASVKVAGDTFNQAILNYVRKNHGLFIGEDMAEKIKIQIGTAIEESNPRTMEVKGRNVITGLPKTVTLTSEEIRVALKDATSQIVETVHGILEKTPPELAADIVDRGIVLTGGGALLHGMDTLIEQRTGVSTLTVQDAMSVVAVGTGKYAEVMARFDG